LTSTARSASPAKRNVSKKNTSEKARITRLSKYLQDQVEAGVIAVDDCEVAAAQFLDSCQSTMFKPVLFNAGPPPSEERIAHVVGMAVRVFLRAYQRNRAPT
jgi:hypothetical protein